MWDMPYTQSESPLPPPSPLLRGSRSVSVSNMPRAICSTFSTSISRSRSYLRVRSRRTYTVLSFGDCSNGALGHRSLCDAYEPEVVEGLPDDVVRIAAGHYHSLAVTASGKLWAWGRNVEHQLGRGAEQCRMIELWLIRVKFSTMQRRICSREKWSYPQEVQGLGGIKVHDAAGSGVVTMAIGTDGTLWAWGKSKRGQLGLGKNIIESCTPEPIQALAGQHIVQVSLGWGHALACTSEGKVYSWGYSADGRLGYSDTTSDSCTSSNFSVMEKSKDDEDLLEAVSKSVEEDVRREMNIALQWEPHLVDLRGLRAVKVACGFDHSLVLCDDTHGQLGWKAVTDSTHEFEVAISDYVVSINAGLSHSLALALSCTNSSQYIQQKELAGTVHSWGWNAAFQLGRTACSNIPGKVHGLEDQVVKVDGGRVHSLAVTLKGELWTWGSGKNGRLGLGSSRDEQQPSLVESMEDVKVQEAVCGMDHTLVLASEK